MDTTAKSKKHKMVPFVVLIKPLPFVVSLHHSSFIYFAVLEPLDLLSGVNLLIVSWVLFGIEVQAVIILSVPLGFEQKHLLFYVSKEIAVRHKLHTKYMIPARGSKQCLYTIVSVTSRVSIPHGMAGSLNPSV